jgi:sec-independent protein translocase protein TatA
MFGIGPMEMLVVGIVAVILFGNRLPEVARSLGRSLTEFKKGMQEFEQEVKTSIYSDTPTRSAYQDRLPSPPPRAEEPVAPQAAVAAEPNETAANETVANN